MRASVTTTSFVGNEFALLFQQVLEGVQFLEQFVQPGVLAFEQTPPVDVDGVLLLQLQVVGPRPLPLQLLSQHTHFPLQLIRLHRSKVRGQRSQQHHTQHWPKTGHSSCIPFLWYLDPLLRSQKQCETGCLTRRFFFKKVQKATSLTYFFLNLLCFQCRILFYIILVSSQQDS